MINLHELTLDNIGQWPYSIKMSSIIFLAILMLGIGYSFFTKDKFEELEHLKIQETILKNDLALKRNQLLHMNENRQQFLSANAHPKQPLERFAIEELTFVGTMTQKLNIWGLVKHTEGRVFSVQEGDYIGNQRGRIVKITLQYILLEETIRQSDRWQKKRVKLKLGEGSTIQNKISHIDPV